MGKYNFSTKKEVYDLTIEHLKETRGKVSGEIQEFVSEAVVEKIEREAPSNATMRFIKNQLIFDKLKQHQDSITKLTKFINFYGTYADKNRTEMLSAIHESDEEMKKLVNKVFDSGKDTVSIVKPILEDMLKSLTKIKFELKHEKSTRIESQKKSLKDIQKEFNFTEEQRELLFQQQAKEELDRIREIEAEQKKQTADKILRQTIEKNPFHKLNKAQKGMVLELHKKENISLLEAREIIMGYE